MKMRTVLDEQQWAGTDCGYIIEHSTNYCWAPAACWDLRQQRVCELCLLHNSKRRFYCRRCERTRIRGDRWQQGIRLCTECLALEIKLSTNAYLKGQAYKMGKEERWETKPSGR